MQIQISWLLRPADQDPHSFHSHNIIYIVIWKHCRSRSAGFNRSQLIRFHTVCIYTINPYIVISNQCRSRSAGFIRSQLIRVQTVFIHTYMVIRNQCRSRSAGFKPTDQDPHCFQTHTPPPPEKMKSVLNIRPQNEHCIDALLFEENFHIHYIREWKKKSWSGSTLFSPLGWMDINNTTWLTVIQKHV